MNAAGVSGQVAAVVEALRRQADAYLVAVVGIPGSGKTTLCEALSRHIPGSVVVPMDGYHLPRSQLDAEGMRRRGAPHTFDAVNFHKDLSRLRQTRAGLFPAFDHAEKDPRPAAIVVAQDTPLVIVEGNYLLLRDWQLESLFDFRIFIDCGLDVATERLVRRHVECGICTTTEEARERAINNDRVNALTILADGCRDRADLILPV